MPPWGYRAANTVTKSLRGCSTTFSTADRAGVVQPLALNLAASGSERAEPRLVPAAVSITARVGLPMPRTLLKRQQIVLSLTVSETVPLPCGAPL